MRLGDVAIEIKVNKGKIRLTHSSFNCDGGSFSCPPYNNQPSHYDIVQCDSVSIQINVGEQFGYIDRIYVVNPSMLECASFRYKVTFLRHK